MMNSHLSCPSPPQTLVRGSALPQWFLTIWAMVLTKGSHWLFPDSWLELASHAAVISHSRVLCTPTIALRSHHRIGCFFAPQKAGSSICQCLLGVSEICDWDIWMQVTPCPWSSHHVLPGSPCCVYRCFLSPWAGWSAITKAGWIFHKHMNSGRWVKRKFYYRINILSTWSLIFMFVCHGVSEWSLLPIFYCTQAYSFLSSI